MEREPGRPALRIADEWADRLPGPPGRGVVGLLQCQLARRQQRIIAPTAAKRFVDDAIQQGRIARRETVAIPPLGGGIDLAAISREALRRQVGHLKLAVRRQADVGAFVESDQLAAVVAPTIRAGCRRLRPIGDRRRALGPARAGPASCPESRPIAAPSIRTRAGRQTAVAGREPCVGWASAIATATIGIRKQHEMSPERSHANPSIPRRIIEAWLPSA